MRWYALRCNTRGELDAMLAVRTYGLHAVVPIEVTQVRKGRRRRPRIVHTVLLPGYVLARMPHGFAARDVPLVRGVVSMNGAPAPLLDRDVLDVLMMQVTEPAPTRKERRLARYLRRIEAMAA